MQQPKKHDPVKCCLCDCIAWFMANKKFFCGNHRQEAIQALRNAASPPRRSQTLAEIGEAASSGA